MCFLALFAAIPFIQNLQDVPKKLELTQNSIEMTTEKAIFEFRDELNYFLKIPEKKRNFDNTIRKWDFLYGNLERTTKLFEYLLVVHPEKNIREKLLSAIQKLSSALLDALESHPEIYDLCAGIKKTRLQETELKYLKRLLVDFEHKGMQLKGEKRALFTKTKKEIADLEKQFEKNMAEDIPKVYLTKEELAGMDDNWFLGREQNKLLAYLVVCDFPTFSSIMKNCSSTETRRKIYELYYNIAFSKNEETLKKLIAKRDELANLLGFSTFAAYDLSLEMAKSPENVEIFFSEIKEKIVQKAEKEFKKVIQSLPENVSLTPLGQLNAYDEAFVYETYRKNHFSIDQNKIAEYFPQNKVVEKLCSTFGHFLNVSIKKAPIALFNLDQVALEIKDLSNQLLGIIILDFYPREGKSPHAAQYNGLIPAYRPKNGPYHPSLGMIVCNFSKPQGVRPALMTHWEVSALFHEFGHAIHDLLSQSEFLLFCGNEHSEFDFVEFPSQLLERWMWDSVFLKEISSHYLTQKPLSDEEIENLIHATCFGNGNSYLQRFFKSKLSLAFFNGKKERSLSELNQKLWISELPYFAFDEKNHFYTSWIHMTSYGPKYYSYFWSEIIVCDAFEKIKKEGLSNPQVGSAYVEAVLSKGSSENGDKMVQDFLGRKVSLEPFFKQLRYE